MQKIKSLQNGINIPELSKDILKKLSMYNLITPPHTTLAELKRNHHNELLESTHTMIKTYFSQVETFSKNFYKVVNNNSTITKHRLNVHIELLSDTINSIKSVSFTTYNDSTQSVFDDAVCKINNEENKLTEMVHIRNMHSLTPIKGKIRCELKEILSEIIFIAQSTKKEMDMLNKTAHISI